MKASAGKGSVKTSAYSQPRIFWQAALILLPVLLLAAVGVYFLREDTRRAEQDVRDQAQGFAETILEVYERELTEVREAPPGQVISFVIDASGELVSPPRIDPVPTPPDLPWEELTEQQRTDWRQATLAEAQAEWENAALAWRKFIESKPPSDLEAIAWYKLGLSLKRKWGDGPEDSLKAGLQPNTLKGGQQTPDAADVFAAVVERFPDARSESGLPLQPLARLQWIETTQLGPAEKIAALSTVVSNALEQPSILNAQLLDRLAQWQSRLVAGDTNQTLPFEQFQQTWAQQEQARALHRMMLPNIQRVLKRPGYVWVDGEETTTHWLAYGVPDETNRFKVICKQQALTEPKAALAALERSRFPQYFGLSLDVARRPVHTVKNGQQFLASAVRSANGEEYLKATIYLADPALFQQRLRTRTFWLTAVIASAAVAALVGLLSAWRAFRRQQALADMKTNFVSSVSHELRAPIASVRLLAEGLESGKIREGAKQQQYLGFIVQECRRLSSLIDNVLDFSRIEEGRKQYQFEPTDLKALVNKTVELMKTYAEEKAVKLEVAENGDEVAGEVDGRAIQQALVNLIDNAVKHSPAGASVQVGLDPGQNGVAFRLWVQDRGEGIPAEDHQRIFERFYRRGSELRRETQGVGIGLSIVKHIVEAHRGKVVVDSAPGKGSRFTIEIP